MSTKTTKKAVAKKAAAPKVAGKFRVGTVIATIFTRLADGKVHTLGQLKPAAKGTDLKYRLYILQKYGAKSREWKLTRDGDKVQLKLSAKVKKAVPKKAAPKKAAPAPANTSVAA